MKALWDFLNSLKLTVYLILAITAVTMYGSFVLYLHPEVFGEMDSNLLFPWLATVGVKNLGYTWWLFPLIAMVVLLGFNTLVCTVSRLPLLVKKYNEPLLNLRDIEMGGGEGEEVALGDGGTATLTGYLEKNRYKVFRDGDNIFAEKNRWLPFMPHVVHAGIMIFMIAHLINGVFGYRNTGLYIFEGQTAKSPAGNYDIRLDKVKVDYREDGSLKDYGSLITAVKGGKEIKTGWVTANTPMFVEGGAVYQRQFGQEFAGIYLYVDMGQGGFRNYVLVPKGADYVEVPGTGYRLSIDRFLADFALDENGQPYSRGDEMVNPTVMVTFYEGARPMASGWVFLREPMRDTFRDSAVSIKFADLDMRAYSSFDVNRDPSALIALIASLIVMFVTVVTLYFRRERVWARLDEATGRAQVVCTDDEMYEGMVGCNFHPTTAENN
ncbi:MAG: cytochrome c biogenesis protein ResB [Nitrospirae bacterium]|nr:cytochrome c biogenesis protein ResB [Nitrospirota bacterium]MBI5694608.1 cytochrome c biogenesis protein ResB [Nitrospirota bacterium]